ncbi:MAG: AraC family transcriptional regulator [Sphaerochaetaceae bacterium]|nr:AraC family transcriptional regulator [Sphaerochaetaceae bacterium]
MLGLFRSGFHKETIKYLRIFLTVTLITLVPLLFITVIVHVYSSIHFRDSYIQMKESQLENIAVAIDEKMLTLDSVVKSLGNNSDVIQFTVSPDTDSYSQNTRIIRELDNYVSSNSNIESIYLYSRAYGSILSSKSGLHPLHQFDDVSWVDQFTRLQVGFPVVIARDRMSAADPAISLMSGIPLRSRDATGALIVNLDERKLHSSIFRHGFEGSTQFIIDSAGVILSHPDPERIGSNYWNTSGLAGLFQGPTDSHFIDRNGQRLFLSYAKGDYTKWYVISEEKASMILGPIRPFLLILMVFVIIAIVFIIIADMNLSRKLYMPVQDLREIEGKFDEVKPLIEEKIIQTILQGTVERRRKLIQDLKKIGLDVSTQLCAGIILEVDNYYLIKEEHGEDCLQNLKHAISERLEITLQDPFYEHMKSEISEHRIAFVVFFTSREEYAPLVSRFTSVLKGAPEDRSHSLTCAVGSVSVGIEAVTESFAHARSLLHYKFLQGPGKIFIHDRPFPVEHNLPDSVVDVNKRILYYLKLADLSHAKEFILTLRDTVPEEIENPLLARDLYISLAHDMASLITQSTDDGSTFLQRNDMIGGIEEQETVDDATKWLLHLAEDVVAALASNDSNRIDEVAKKILSYIDGNLENKNISLTDIGEEVGLSASYVSKIFKEYCGYNYLEYLNRGRVERSIELLEGTSFTVEEIGDRVGFSSTQSFLRVFQKYQKTTPGKYRMSYRRIQRSS